MNIRALPVMTGNKPAHIRVYFNGPSTLGKAPLSLETLKNIPMDFLVTGAGQILRESDLLSYPRTGSTRVIIKAFKKVFFPPSLSSNPPDGPNGFSLCFGRTRAKIANLPT